MRFRTQFLTFIVFCLFIEAHAQETQQYQFTKKFVDVIEKKNEVWFFTNFDIRITDKKYQIQEILGAKNGYHFSLIADVEKGKKEDVFIGTVNGLAVLQNKKLKYIKDFDNIAISKLSFNHQTNELWVGTNGKGLALLKPNGEVKFYTEKDGVNAYISTLFVDSKSRVWISYALSGFKMFDGKNWIDKSAGLNTMLWATTITEDKNHDLWVGTLINGVNILKDNTWTRHEKDPDTFNATIVNDIEIDKNNTKWISSEKGIFSYDNKTWKKIYADSLKIKKSKGHIFQMLKVGTDLIANGFDESIIIDDKQKMSKFKLDIPQDIPFTVLKNGFFTMEGNLCIINEKLGIAKLVEDKFILEKAETVDTTCANCKIMTDSLGNFIVGTEKNGFLVLKNNKWEKYPIDIKKNILTHFQDGNTLWVGAVQGIYEYSAGNLIEHSLNNPVVKGIGASTIIKDKFNNIWINAYKDIYKYSNKNWEKIEAKVLIDNTISDMKFDAEGVLWVATEKGIVYYKDNNWQLIKEDENKMPVKLFNGVMIDENNTKWFTAFNGIYTFDQSLKKREFGTGQVVRMLFVKEQDKYFISNNYLTKLMR